MTRNKILNQFRNAFEDIVNNWDIEDEHTPEQFVWDDCVASAKYVIIAHIDTCLKGKQYKYCVSELDVIDENGDNQGTRFDNLRRAMSDALPYYEDYIAENNELADDETYSLAYSWH